MSTLTNAWTLICEQLHSRDGGKSFQPVGTSRNYFDSCENAIGALRRWNNNRHRNHTWRYALVESGPTVLAGSWTLGDFGEYFQN